MSDATWLADVLRDEGCDVTEIDGWTTRRRAGSPSTLDPQVVVGHHTAGASSGEMPSLNILINGRADLSGPLCNVGLARSGRYYIVAAGPSNNAGPGGWAGFSGNYRTLGIEAENDGYQDWPQVQLDAYVHGSAAMLRHLGFDADRWCRHHEWAAYKPDPHGIDGPFFRAVIGGLITPGPPVPGPVNAPPPVKKGKIMSVFITTYPVDPRWWLYDGFQRRPVEAGENVQLVQNKVVEPGPDGTPQVFGYTVDRMAKIPVAPGWTA